METFTTIVTILICALQPLVFASHNKYEAIVRFLLFHALGIPQFLMSKILSTLLRHCEPDHRLVQ